MTGVGTSNNFNLQLQCQERSSTQACQGYVQMYLLVQLTCNAANAMISKSPISCLLILFLFSITIKECAPYISRHLLRSKHSAYKTKEAQFKETCLSDFRSKDICRFKDACCVKLHKEFVWVNICNYAILHSSLTITKCATIHIRTTSLGEHFWWRHLLRKGLRICFWGFSRDTIGNTTLVYIVKVKVIVKKETQ